MSKNSKKGQAAARESKRDAWQQERDEDTAREDVPHDDYEGIDAFARDVQEFRS